MSQLFANNVEMQLASNLGANDTSFTVVAGQGSQCPTITANDANFMLITFTDKNGNKEIVKVIEHLSGSDVFTIGDDESVPHVASVNGRAYEPTFDGYQTALAIDAADSHKIRMPITAATLQECLVVAGSGITNEDLTDLHLGYGIVPVGGVIAYIPGYFTNGSNAGFTYQGVSANTVAAVNTLMNPKGFYVMDGSALNDPLSSIFNGSGRYLPNATDSRFLMGSTTAGAIGGANSITLAEANMPAHVHTITINSGGAHTHSIYICSPPGGGDWLPDLATGGTAAHATSSNGSHTHTATASYAGSGTAFDSRNLFLSCYYLMRAH
jgi:hypothetical protein